MDKLRIYVHTFFFSRSAEPRDLHSFPTRRSSDLVYAVASGKQQARAVALVPTREALYFSSDTPFETNHIYRYRDRKSTRLNSSHGSISYAVFCLKKKKFCSGRPANAIA